MQIVSDRAMDLTNEQMTGLNNIALVPLVFTLDGKSYRSGEDIQPDEFYHLLASTESFPTTSQPSAGDFAELYKRVAAIDPEILSIHISSGLSGTLNSAIEGAKIALEAKVTHFDSKTLSGALGWQVWAAARAAQAGWSKEKIIALIQKIGDATNMLYTLSTMKYLIHGGRISHLKGLLATVLNIKPIIGVEKEFGKYFQQGQERTLKRAVEKLADYIAQQHPLGSALRIQIMHGNNIEEATRLREKLNGMFNCTWLPTCSIAPVLGAHTGPGLVGVVFAPQAVFAEVP